MPIHINVKDDYQSRRKEGYFQKLSHYLPEWDHVKEYLPNRNNGKRYAVGGGIVAALFLGVALDRACCSKKVETALNSASEYAEQNRALKSDYKWASQRIKDLSAAYKSMAGQNEQLEANYKKALEDCPKKSVSSARKPPRRSASKPPPRRIATVHKVKPMPRQVYTATPKAVRHDYTTPEPQERRDVPYIPYRELPPPAVTNPPRHFRLTDTGERPPGNEIVPVPGLPGNQLQYAKPELRYKRLRDWKNQGVNCSMCPNPAPKNQ